MDLDVSDPAISAERVVVADVPQVTVTIDRADAGNTLSADGLTALEALFSRLEPDHGRVVRLRSAGRDFCTGADLGELHPVEADDLRESATHLQDLVRSMRSCPLVVLAAVDGRALGAGFHLCLGADLVVATPAASFGLPEARFGIPVAGFATTLLPRIVGERRAREWLLAAEPIEPTEAEAAGFVSETVPRDRLAERVTERVAAIGATDPTAVSLLKRQLRPPLGETDESAARAAERAAMETAARDGTVAERVGDFLGD